MSECGCPGSAAGSFDKGPGKRIHEWNGLPFPKPQNISFVAANSKSILGTLNFGYLASQEALRALTFYEKVSKKNIFSCIILL